MEEIAKVKIAPFRRWKPTSLQSEGSHFSVVQYNALARSFADAKSFPYVDEATLDYEQRKHRILLQVLDPAVVGMPPHLIAMEEMEEDDYNNFFLEEFKKKGYASRFHAKRDGHKDGCMIAWQTATFIRARGRYVPDFGTGVHVGDLPGKSQIYIYVDLIHAITGRCIRFAATHFKAKVGHEEVRLQQAKAIVEHMKGDYKSGGDCSYDELILCGDFNDVPSSLFYNYLQGQEDLPMESCYVKFPSDYNLDAEEDESPLTYSHEAPFTTYKKRDTTIRRTIDYIWATKGLSPTAVLDIKDDCIRDKGLPNCFYPSDHMLIGAALRFAE